MVPLWPNLKIIITMKKLNKSSEIKKNNYSPDALCQLSSVATRTTVPLGSKGSDSSPGTKSLSMSMI